MWHKLLLVATFVAFIDTGNSQSCTATNGKKCVFPFFHKGRRFNGCTKFTVKGNEPAWCSTKVDKGGVHIKGNYADCPSSCPKDKPDLTESRRRAFVKEDCKVNRGKNEGVCVPANDCKTVTSPKKGSCSNSQHVCCFYEKPKGATNGKVNSAMRKTSGYKFRPENKGTDLHAAFNLPKQGAYAVDLAGRRIQEAAEDLGNEIGFSSRSSSIGGDLRGFNADNNEELKKECPWFFEHGRKKFYPCSQNDRPKYRRVDGTCNLLSAPHLGQAMTPFSRLFGSADYGPVEDAQGRIRGLRVAKSGRDLPSARKLSTSLADITRGGEAESSIMSLYVMQMGQFIDHDLAHSPNNDHRKCCDPGNNDPECIPIKIPRDDPYYSPHGMDCMPLARAMTAPNLNCELDGERQQFTQITHWLDASNVYGSTEHEIELLRTFRDGLMKIADKRSSNMLPKCDENPSFTEKGEPGEEPEVGLEACHGPGSSGFGAGDMRVNEHHGLTSMHTVWVREHNRVAKELKRNHRSWDDEKLFEEARRIVIAEYQHIIYNEWMPIILGHNYMDGVGILTLDSGYSDAYFAEGARPEQFDPRVSNEFATAAFRFGHSLIPSRFHVPFERKGRPISEYTLRSAFGDTGGEFREDTNGTGVPYNGDNDLVNEVLEEFANQKGENWDSAFAEDIVNHLFERRDDNGRQMEGTGRDLVAINIQRGRDHGIPSYNAMREFCQLGRAKKFSDFGKEMLPENWKKLEAAYDGYHPDDVDLFAGGFMEQSGGGCGGSGFTQCGILGPVFRCIVGDTFTRLRYGDRYFYDLGHDDHKFSLGELSEIRKTSFAKVLCDNTPSISRMQPEAFKIPSSKVPQRTPVSCGQIPGMDLSKFRGLD